MSEMIERVAKAIFKDYDWSFAPKAPFEEQELHLQEIFRNLAKAAIAAMREPTDAMVKAAWRRNDDNDGKEADRENWQSMIDAALS